MVAVRTVGGLVHPQKIEEMERELTEVIEDFDRAMNVEALRLAKKIDEDSKHSLSQYGDSSFSVVSCRRAGAFAYTASTCQDRLSPGPPLYGRHPPSYP
jgi:hypothetical protein